MENEFDLKVREFRRQLVAELLNQCTTDQKNFFNRMYGGIDIIEDSKLRNAYSQCKRTVEENRNV